MDDGHNDLPLVNRLDHQLDHATPALRRELLFRPQTFAGKQCYVLEDPVAARFFRVGVNEHAFLSRLDGKRTIGQALEETCRARHDCQFTSAEALAICQWTVRSGLVQESSGRALAATGHARRGGRVSALSVQVPLFHPDGFFQGLAKRCSWLFSMPAVVGWAVVLLWAGRELVVHQQRLTSSSGDILAANNWLWLAVAWVVLKVIHECGHAVACKRLGGEVREAGVIFILLAPLAYVDVTSSWRLSCKWQRIAVAAAGMYVELFVAAIAAIAWSRLAPGVWSQICLNVVVTASITTVLFNANPLMRFDGYYILSDLLEIPNLYASGQLYVRYFVRRYMLAVPAVTQAGTQWRDVFVRGYGMVAWGWRTLVFWGLVLTAATLLDGAGVVLSAIAVVVWGLTLLQRSVRFVRGELGGQPNWLRFSLVTGGAAMVGYLALTCLPWPGAVTAPAIVEFKPEVVVRSHCDGFVCKVHVRGGDFVEEGQLLVEMINDDLQHELADLQLEMEQSRVRRRAHRRQRELAKAQAELKKLSTLKRQFAQKQEEVDQLVLRAPAAGMVVARNLDSLEGTYQTKGTQLLSLGNEEAKAISLSIAQSDIAEFRQNVNQTMRVHFDNALSIVAPLNSVEPRATRMPLDPALCAPNGGNLVVRAKADSSDDGGSQEYELVTPRFTAALHLTAEQSRRLRAGQRARVVLRGSETVGQYFSQQLVDWVDTKLRRRRAVSGLFTSSGVRGW